MAPLSNRRAMHVDSRGEARCHTSSPTSLVVLVVVAAGLGELGVLIVNRVVTPLWWYLEPKPSSVFALLESVGLASYETPSSAGPYSVYMWCLIARLYVPDILLMGLVAFQIGWFFPRVFFRLTIAFVIGESLTKGVLQAPMECPDVVAYALGYATSLTKVVSPLGYVLMTVFIYAPTFLAAWIASRWTNRRTRQGHCLKCDYPLEGLPQRRCPGCGIPLISNMYVRCVTCVFLYAGFLCLRVELACSLLRDAMVVLLSYTDVGVVALSYEGFPALAVGGRPYPVVPACTYLGLVLILSPFLWVFDASWWRNAIRIVGVGVVVLGVNLVRVWASIHFEGRGIDWFYTHDLPNYAIWSGAILIVVIAAIRRDFRTGKSKGVGMIFQAWESRRGRPSGAGPNAA